MGKFAQGKYTPKNPEKYVGNNLPHYRSSWELVLCQFCDNHPGVIQWASESIKIPYVNPFTGKRTVYVPDFFIVSVDKNGQKRAELIEVKPHKETSLEAAGRSKKAQAAAILNQAKWQAANAWAKANGVKFRIMTENDMFAQGKPPPARQPKTRRKK